MYPPLLFRFVRLTFFLTALLAQGPAAQAALNIVKQPASVSRSLGDRTTLSVSVSGDFPVYFQWYRDGSPWLGATNRNLSLTNLTADLAGTYTVVVTNAVDTVTSDPAVLEVDTLFTFLVNSPVSRDNAWGPSWGDYDDDGYLDLHNAGDSGHLLYHNERDGTFTKIGRTNAIVGRAYTSSSLYAAYWADYDGDGQLDLFAPVGTGNSTERNHLFRGLGNGRFESVSNAPVGREVTEGWSAAWTDFNRDGLLDIFVANTPVDSNSAKTTNNTIYLGQPNGGFVRWRPPGLEAFLGRNYGCAVGDFNGDGFPDIALSVRQPPSLEFVILFNQAGTDFDAFVVAAGGINYGGISAGDFDNNGSLDLLGSWANGTGNRLLRNDGSGNFEDVRDIGPVTEPARSISPAWGDYNNDGYLDVFVPRTAEAAGNEPNDSLWRNNGDGTFSRVTAGSVGNDGVNSQGAAWGDYDNDGFLDLVVAASPGPSRLYHNNGNTNAWLLLKLVGTKSNRSAIGAKVRLNATLRGQTLFQFREIGAGACFGQNDPRAHFGLGDATKAAQIDIEWPSGTKQTLTNLDARQILTITEPDGQLRVRFGSVGEGAVGLFISGDPGANFVVETSNDLRDWKPFERLGPAQAQLDQFGQGMVLVAGSKEFPTAWTGFLRARIP